MIRILLIAPYQELADSFRSFAGEFDDVRIDIHVGDLNEALLYFNLSIKAKNYDVVISRGGTARLIRENTNLPVIEVEVSLLDMHSAIKQAEQMGRSYVIVAFSNITATAKALASISQMDIAIRDIDSADDARALLAPLASADGSPLILGDNVTVNIASELGLDSLRITSGRESVLKAVRMARDMAGFVKNASREDALCFKALDKAPCTIAVFNAGGRLTYLNHAVPDISSVYLSEMLGELVPDVIQCGNMRLRRRIRSQRLDITAVALNSDAGEKLAAFYINSGYCYTTKSMQGLLTEESFEDVQKKETPNRYPPYYFQPYLRQVSPILSVGSPLMVYGEAGTGKDSFVNNIYLKKIGVRSPLVTVYCPMLTERKWAQLIHDTNSPLYGENMVIFFKSIHALPVDLQRRLDLFLSETNLTARNYVLSSARYKLTDMVVSGQFVQSLYARLDSCSVFLPPLRERKNEIMNIASYFLGTYNARYGKNILGFTDDVVPLLLDHHWRMNIEELRQTVKKLSTTVNQGYISADMVEKILLSLSDDRSEILPIDLSKTMDEIELDIINFVLKMENQNHSQAAARLGISRSTIWRKLNGARRQAALSATQPPEA